MAGNSSDDWGALFSSLQKKLEENVIKGVEGLETVVSENNELSALFGLRDKKK